MFYKLTSAVGYFQDQTSEIDDGRISKLKGGTIK